MKHFIILSTILLFFFGSTTFSQVTQEWVQRYSGPGNHEDNAYAIVVDDSGNAYVTGKVYSTVTNYDYFTIKYNSSGVQQWTAIYIGPGIDDEAYSVGLDHSGNVYVTGRSSGEGGSYFSYCTIKYNSSGNQQWVQRYHGPGTGNDQASSIAVDDSGNAYVTGSSVDSVTGYDYCTLKYNSSGVLLWAARYVGPGNSAFAHSVAADNSGNVYVTGTSGSTSTTIRYNSSGIQQWVASTPGATFVLSLDDSGNVYVAGRGSGGYLTIKYNSSGVQQWLTGYHGNGTDAVYSIAVDASRNVYVTGSIKTGGSTGYDFATVKYSPSGTQQWTATYSSAGYSQDAANSIAVDAFGNIYVTGGGSGAYNTLKYNSSGVQQWLEIYNDFGGGGQSILALGPSGSVYVTGASQGSGTGLDITTIKYSQLVGIQPISNETPKEFSLSQNYPNPFNPSTKIRFDIPKQALTRITVFDILGREVVTLVNEELNAGKYEVEFKTGSYSSGLYFYKFEAGDYSEVKKMVLVK
jgi:hypothetical protein